MQDIRLAI